MEPENGMITQTTKSDNGQPPLEFTDKMHDWMAKLGLPVNMHSRLAKQAWDYFRESQYYAEI